MDKKSKSHTIKVIYIGHVFRQQKYTKHHQNKDVIEQQSIIKFIIVGFFIKIPIKLQ